MIGYNQTESGYNRQKYQRKTVNSEKMSGRQNAVKQPCKDKTIGKYHKTYQPIRYQLGSNKREFTDRCHIDLFNCTRLFLAHHIKGGKKAANQRQQHHH